MIVQPRKRAFNDPSFRQHHEGADSVYKSDLQSAIAGKLKQFSLDKVLDDLEKLRTIEIEDNIIWKNDYLVIKSSATD